MTIAAPDRTAVLAGLFEQWDVLAHLTDGLDETSWRTPSPLPGWTVFDVLAHVVGTESMLLGEPVPEVDTDVRALPHIRNDIGALNEAWLESLRPLTGAQLLQRFSEVTGRRRTALTALDDAAWKNETTSPVGQVAYGRFMRVRLFDCWMHQLDITDALGGDPDALGMTEGGARAGLAIDEIEASLGRVVVKRGGATDGSAITFALTGPLQRTINVRVDGRAEVVETLDRSADVVIRLSSGLFARLCGGRTTAAERRDGITVDGDGELGTRITENLAFTI
ncbi:MAG: maleylpyruvate isomerase family mycothiol-dependent enzyme [Nocardia sp.]|nr:maleylpyruvate isomerase family mycothiol-dependent enzyme [Nocardia sp.]